MKEFNSDRGLLEEIHSWLCFIQQPSKKDTEDLRRDIKNHLDKKVGQIEPPVIVQLAEAERLLKETLTCHNNDKDNPGVCCQCREAIKNYFDESKLSV